jgi:hypothetical protein
MPKKKRSKKGRGKKLATTAYPAYLDVSRWAAGCDDPTGAAWDYLAIEFLHGYDEIQQRFFVGEVVLGLRKKDIADLSDLGVRVVEKMVDDWGADLYWAEREADYMRGVVHDPGGRPVFPRRPRY